MNKLSHSSVSVYKECGHKYRLQYIDRVRPKSTASALVFGSAIDKTIENAFKNFPNCNEIDSKRFFVKEFQTTKINDNIVDTMTIDLIKWSKVDLDEDLADNAFMSMSIKGALIIESFYKNFLPKVEKVISVQEEISLVNSNNDAITGFCDLVVKLKDYDKPIILDIKTSGKSYRPGVVQLSEQLALYKHSLSEKYNTDLVGFVVFSKDIKKTVTKECLVCKCTFINPRVKTCDSIVEYTVKKRCNGEFKIIVTQFESPFQLMIDTVDEKFVDNVLNDFDISNVQIQAGEFKKNFKNCFGRFGRCNLYDYCRNGDRENFIIKEKK